MNANDYLSMLFERSNAAQSLWNFEAVVVLGIVGFVATNVGNVLIYFCICNVGVHRFHLV